MRTKKLLIAALIALAVCACSGPEKDKNAPEANRPGYRKISAEEAKNIMDGASAAIILDVRTLAEFQERHIARSTLLPVDQIQARASTVLPDKEAQILVYCRRGRRSQTAANALVSMGYKNVYDFGGLDTWNYGTVSGTVRE